MLLIFGQVEASILNEIGVEGPSAMMYIMNIMILQGSGLSCTCGI